MLRALALLGMAVIVPAVTWAEESSAAVGELEDLISRQKEKVEAILLQQQRGMADGCGKLAVLMASAVTVYEPLEVASGKPVKGSWQVRYAVDACGVAQMRNIAMDVVGGNIALAEMAPGDTLTDRALQQDVVTSFGMAAKVAMPACDGAAEIRETRVRVHPKTPKDAWQELWIGRMCGRDIGQVVMFMPNETGTSFKMSLPKPSAKK